MTNLCVICGVRPVEKRPAVSSTFCRACASSYDTDGGGDGSVMEAILWAAKRARAGERAPWEPDAVRDNLGEHQATPNLLVTPAFGPSELEHGACSRDPS